MRGPRCAVGRTVAILALAVLATGSLAAAQEYEGFGAVTQGALSSPTGYTVYRVTSLADSGAGTLRDAVSRGNRLVVFDVGGTIRLSNDLYIYESYITIDGSSAPAPGLTIEQPGEIVTAIYARSNRPVHDVIIHTLRRDGLSPGSATGRSSRRW